MTVEEWANWLADHEAPDELAEALVGDPALATQRTSLGNTLLHEAAWHKRTPAVAALLAAGFVVPDLLRYGTNDFAVRAPAARSATPDRPQTLRDRSQFRRRCVLRFAHSRC